MKYMLLIYGDERVWSAMSPEDAEDLRRTTAPLPRR